MELSGQSNALSKFLGLVPYSVLSEYKCWQIFTYLFVHGSFFHLSINMFGLWIFGNELERDWGNKNFILYKLQNQIVEQTFLSVLLEL